MCDSDSDSIPSSSEDDYIETPGKKKPTKAENLFACVKGQVMHRDDTFGGWLPLLNGGMANVLVRKRLHPTRINALTGEHVMEYVISAKRISDCRNILYCVLKKNFIYKKPLPTFHHWNIGGKKYGLTFQSTADADIFEAAVQTALEEFLNGNVPVIKIV